MAVDPPDGRSQIGWYHDGDTSSPRYGLGLDQFLTDPAEAAAADAVALTPVFRENPSITFQKGRAEATETASLRLAPGTLVVAPAEPTCEDYAFAGWFTSSDLSGSPYVFSTMPYVDLELHAKWIVATTPVTLSFDAQGGIPAVMDAVEKSPGASLAADRPGNPKKSGYEFGGWFLDSAGTTPFVFSTMPDEDITVYAKWISGALPAKTLSFDSQGGAAVRSLMKRPGADISLDEPLATRPGYIFSGWYETPDCMGERFAFTVMPTAGMTLYAKWTDPVPPAGRLVFDTGAGSAVADIEGFLGDHIAAPADPMRTGYEFAGWFTDTACTAAFDLAGPLPRGTTTLHAKWKPVVRRPLLLLVK